MKRRTITIVPVVLALVLTLSLTAGCQFAPLSATGVVSPPPAATSAPQVASSASTGALAAMEGTLEDIYTQVNPSVVKIEVSQKVTQTQNPFSGLPFPDWMFPQQQAPQDQYQEGSGSGFVYDTQGDIITNNHVIDGADRIQVTFADGTVVTGKVVGADPDSDLAVVKVDVAADELHPVTMGDSTQVKVGSLAVAIGQPFGLDNTMTVGIISAIGRSMPANSEQDSSSSTTSYTIPDVIQTDAPINPGNSGGVLLDSAGEVIGVTTAIISPVRASAGIGFAVPSAIVQQVVPVLIDKGEYTYPWLGISGTTLVPDLATAMNLDANQHGALVVDVTPGSAADKAGLKGSDRSVTIDGQDARVGGDVITAIDGTTVKTFDDLVSYLVQSTQVGQKVTLTVLRDGKEQQVEATLSARSDNTAQPQQVNQQEQTGPLWLGISGLDLSSQVNEAAGLPRGQEGVLVQEIAGGSPADKAGLRGSYKPVTVGGQQVLVGGDVITGWNNQQVTSMDDLRSYLSQSSAGDEVALTILRDGHETTVQLTLEAQPAS